MEVRVYVEDYGTLVIKPQTNNAHYTNISIIDDDANATESDFLVLSNSELNEFIRALTCIRISNVADMLSN